MAAVKDGDYVRVHYTGKLTNGEIFDSSEGHEPLSFTVGGGEMIAGFDEAVRGMEVGESKNISIPAGQAYGERRDDLIQTLPREIVQLGIEPEVGMQVEVQREDGTTLPLMISQVDENSITLDANHPLAGEELHFNIQLMEISS